eukprot:TRINITY_DN2300_c0_g1_i1.p1 TRINITY_DN2300_c0_g1~~TRINITY_DN2300_c0_g1_i1.p1  ORF type:complete len:710 (+),score=243.53 TRINITY_DN2300_c0_g1_i1:68-2197(+)
MGKFGFGLSLLVGVATAADPKKSAAVDMVLKMLSDVGAKVEAEGEEEAKTFLKFDRFCNDTVEETTASITEGNNKIASVNAQITSLTASNQETTAGIAELNKDIATLKTAIKDLAAERAEEAATYASGDKDLSNAIYGIDHSISELKAKQSTSFLQKKSFQKAVQAAVFLADSLGLKTNAMGSLDATDDTSYEDIVSMLEELQTKFRASKESADLEEAKAVTAFKLASQAQTNQLKNKQDALAQNEADIAQMTKEIAVANQDLAETKAAKKEDDDYLAETTASCTKKRAIHAQHESARADELAALSQAKTIMEEAMASPSASAAPSSKVAAAPSPQVAAAPSKVADMLLLAEVASASAADQDLLSAADAEASAIEQEEKATRPSLGFLQMPEQRQQQPRRHVQVSAEREALVSLLSRTAQRLHSQQLAALATKAESDPFAEIKTLISGLITKLQSQMAESQSKKAFCDKEIGAAELARDDASKAIKQLNTELASAQARRDSLAEDVQELDAAVAALDTKKKELVQIRAEEAKEAEETISESAAAVKGVKQAKQVIADFYSQASKATALLQKPDEAYKGNQGASKGIIGTLEVIESDFERTISDTKASEVTATTEHQRTLNDMAVSKAEKLKSKELKTNFGLEANQTIADGTSNLQGETSKLKSALLQLKMLEEKCGVGDTHEARKAARAQEMQALEEAISAIDSMNSIR